MRAPPSSHYPGRVGPARDTVVRPAALSASQSVQAVLATPLSAQRQDALTALLYAGCTRLSAVQRGRAAVPVRPGHAHLLCVCLFVTKKIDARSEEEDDLEREK